MKKDIKTKIQILAIYQIIGGVKGLWLIIFLLVTKTLSSSMILLISIPFAALYIYSIYCGAILFSDQRQGLKLSKINQIIQIMSFIAFGYGFQYISGVFFTIGFDLTNEFVLRFNLGLSSWFLNIDTSVPDLLLSINVVAIFLVVFIDKIQSQLKLLTQQEQFDIEKSRSNEIYEVLMK